MAYQLYIIALLFLVEMNKGDPCTDYKEIDDWTRSVASGFDDECDGFLEAGWYRVTSKAGELMPTECIQYGGRCGSMYNVWINGSYPSNGQTVNVTACASNLDGDCCFRSYDIQVKNCSAYYVFYLVPVQGCPQRYCFGTELPCPEGHTSVNGYSPGCYYEPCLESNYKNMTEWERSLNYKETHDICDSFMEPGWYRPTSLAGELMPTTCPQNGFTCGTMYPVWMNGSYPKEGKISNVTACASSHLDGCCFRNYDIQVKNCGGFFIYNLERTFGCDQGYCFGTEIPCPAGHVSENGFTPGCKYDPCLEENYKNMSEWERSLNYNASYDICDSFLEPGWYRPTSLAGDRMPTHCPEYAFACGTMYPVWMNGTFPEIGEISDAKACASSHLQGCCFRSYDIQVKNCGEFYLYNLPPTFNCNQGYCFGTEVPCPVGQESENGFTPGCEFDPCQNFDIIKNDDQRSSANVIDDEVGIDDSTLTKGWYRFDGNVGNDLVSTSQELRHCGTVYPVWMDGEIPTVSDKTVNRTCCVTGEYSNCESKVQIQVKNCGEFRVYNLAELMKSPAAYCVGTLPVPSTSTANYADHTHKLRTENKIYWIIAVVLGIGIVSLLISILVIRYIRKNTPHSPAVSCVSLERNPPSYEETINSKKNSFIAQISVPPVNHGKFGSNPDVFQVHCTKKAGEIPIKVG